MHANAIKKPTSFYVEFLKIIKILARENKNKIVLPWKKYKYCTNVECFKNTDIFAGRLLFEVRIYTAKAGLKLPV